MSSIPVTAMKSCKPAACLRARQVPRLWFSFFPGFMSFCELLFWSKLICHFSCGIQKRRQPWCFLEDSGFIRTESRRGDTGGIMVVSLLPGRTNRSQVLGGVSLRDPAPLPLRSSRSVASPFSIRAREPARRPSACASHQGVGRGLSPWGASRALAAVS